jgi:phosphate starvation-inducible membrane PsiE
MHQSDTLAGTFYKRINSIDTLYKNINGSVFFLIYIIFQSLKKMPLKITFRYKVSMGLTYLQRVIIVNVLLFLLLKF